MLTLTDQEAGALARFAAELDALHLNSLEATQPFWRAVALAVRECRIRGGMIPYTGGGDTAEAKREQRAIASLVDRGLMRSQGEARGRRLGLTTAGHLVVRKLLCWWPSLAESVEALRVLLDTPTRVPRGWAPGWLIDGLQESWLAVHRMQYADVTLAVGDADDLMMLPWYFGWVEPRPNTRAFRFYRVTEEGRAVVDGETPLPECPEVSVNIDFTQVYLDAYPAGRDRARALTDRASNLAYICWPAVWWWDPNNRPRAAREWLTGNFSDATDASSSG